MRQVIYIFLTLGLLAGCTHPHGHDHGHAHAVGAPVVAAAGPVPWTSLQFINDPDRFQFAIVGDRTGRHRPGVFETGIEKLNLLQPEFVMSVGDLIEGYTRDEAEIDQQWDEIEGFIAKLQAPFFYLPGNHDISNSIQARKWAQRFGKSYYHFVYRDVLFLIINTSDPQSRLSSAQIAYMAAALKENPAVRWTCVFMHEPLWAYTSETRWDEMEKLLLDRPYTVFAGHTHTYTKYIRHDRRYLVLATTGGGMKGHLRSPEMGAFDHVTWVTMTPDGPLVANIELEAIHDENVRTEAQAIVINRVLGGNVLQISPLLIEAEQFERAPATLTLTNEAEVPMAAAGTIPAQGGLRVEPARFNVTVPPGASATVPVEVRAQKPTPVNELSPLTVKWTASYQLPKDKPVRVPSENVLAVDRINPCPPRTSPVNIDGKLDEWPELPVAYAPTRATATPEKWGGPADSSYRFGVAHDPNYLYIAIKTIDDKSVLHPLKEPWSQDGMEVRLDARPEPLRSHGRGRGELKDILVVSMSAAAAGGKMVLHAPDDLPSGVKAVCVKTDTGYAAEIAVPVSYLNEKQGGPWSAFRMNIAVNDYDQVAGPLRALWWRPDWRSADTFAGSGTFQRK